MKKLLCLVLTLFLLPVAALADQADDLIATLSEENKAAVQIALVTADANHRDGQPYKLKIRTPEGSQEYSFTEEEYLKLKAWVEGKYAPGTPIKRDISAQEWTNQWMNDNGYTFPVYGATTADLTPISDFLGLLAENNIYLALPELQISEKTDFDWISSQIADNFWLLYRPYHDGSRYVLQLQLPYSYRPMEEAFPLLLVSTLSIGISDADALFGTLQYNIVNDSCTLRTDSYTITYSEPRLSDGKLADFAVLEVEKLLK